MNALEFLIIFVAFAFGGILKGATGAGAPIIVVPLLAMYNGVVFAVTVFVIPLVGAMPIGVKLIQHVSKDVFDRIILALLFVLATKLVTDIL